LPKEYSYSSDFEAYKAILLADVKPYRIVGGHVTTNIFKDLSLVAVRLVTNKRSLPITIDFHESTLGYQDNAVWDLVGFRYVTLARKMKGYYWWGAGDNAHKVDTELEDITHLFLIAREYDLNLHSHDTVSMTLVLEPDKVDLGKGLEKGERPINNVKRKPIR
jgi:hypothetical protein